jgi:hypothetical protein
VRLLKSEAAQGLGVDEINSFYLFSKLIFRAVTVVGFITRLFLPGARHFNWLVSVSAMQLSV